MKNHEYWVYIMTNYTKTVLYIGVTNDLDRRTEEHYSGKTKGFTEKYKCKYLIYYEYFIDINDAIHREKQIKKYSRKKKEDLINKFNPDWTFLNDTALP